MVRLLRFLAGCAVGAGGALYVSRRKGGALGERSRARLREFLREQLMEETTSLAAPRAVEASAAEAVAARVEPAAAESYAAAAPAAAVAAPLAEPPAPPVVKPPAPPVIQPPVPSATAGAPVPPAPPLPHPHATVGAPAAPESEPTSPEDRVADLRARVEETRRAVREVLEKSFVAAQPPAEEVAPADVAQPAVQAEAEPDAVEEPVGEPQQMPVVEPVSVWPLPEEETPAEQLAAEPPAEAQVLEEAPEEPSPQPLVAEPTGVVASEPMEARAEEVAFTEAGEPSGAAAEEPLRGSGAITEPIVVGQEAVQAEPAGSDEEAASLAEAPVARPLTVWPTPEEMETQAGAHGEVSSAFGQATEVVPQADEEAVARGEGEPIDLTSWTGEAPVAVAQPAEAPPAPQPTAAGVEEPARLRAMVDQIAVPASPAEQAPAAPVEAEPVVGVSPAPSPAPAPVEAVSGLAEVPVEQAQAKPPGVVDVAMPEPPAASAEPAAQKVEAGHIDQAEMRRRIEETRNRLKAKAFDAMTSGEAALLSRDGESETAPALAEEAPIDPDVASALDRSLSQDDY